jgi:hypothetical protein
MLEAISPVPDAMPFLAAIAATLNIIWICLITTEFGLVFSFHAFYLRPWLSDSFCFPSSLRNQI